MHTYDKHVFSEMIAKGKVDRLKFIEYFLHILFTLLHMWVQILIWFKKHNVWTIDINFRETSPDLI